MSLSYNNLLEPIKIPPETAPKIKLKIILDSCGIFLKNSLASDISFVIESIIVSLNHTKTT